MNKKFRLRIRFLSRAHLVWRKAITNLLKKCYGSRLWGINSNSLKFELNLKDNEAVKRWFESNKPNIVILAAAKVGNLANSNYPADFLIDNLRIQTNVIENAWKFGVEDYFFGSSYIYPKLAKQPIERRSCLMGN